MKQNETQFDNETCAAVKRKHVTEPVTVDEEVGERSSNEARQLRTTHIVHDGIARKVGDKNGSEKRVEPRAERG